MKDRLKLIRKNANQTQAEMAEALGISVSNVASYEAGRRSPSSGVVGLICKTYRISEEWLRTGEGEMYIPQDVASDLAELTVAMLKEPAGSFKARMLNIMVNLTPDQWKLLEDIARQLVADENKKRADHNGQPSA